VFDVMSDLINKVTFLLTVLFDGLDGGVNVLTIDAYTNDEGDMI